MCVGGRGTKGDKIVMATHFELADVGYHVRQEGVAGDVERDPQTLGGGGGWGENTLLLERDCSE